MSTTINRNTVNMSTGNIKKIILVFAFPIFLSNLFQQLYNSVDSFIVGNYIGKEALAAVSSSGSLIFLLTSFFLGTSLGAGVVIAKYFGKNDLETMQKAIHTNIALGLISSIILTIIGVVFTPLILILMRTDSEVLPNSIAYFRFYFMGITGVIMYNVLTGTLNAVGNSRTPLYFLIFSSIMNVLLDFLFIAVFRLGVAWAAIATSISQFMSAILCFLYLLKKPTVYQVKIKNIKIDKKIVKEIIRYGVPSGIQNSVIGLANVFVQSNINTFGKNAMAACGAYAKIEGFAFLPITCFTMAISTFISQNLGAHELKRAREGARFGILSSIILAEVIGIILYSFAPYLIGIFNNDPEVVKIGTSQIRIECLFLLFLAFSHCIAAVCRGSGKAFVPMFIMLFVWCFLRVLYITIIMMYDHNIKYIFWAYPLTWFISSVIYFIYYFKSNWINNFEKEDLKNN